MSSSEVLTEVIIDCTNDEKYMLSEYKVQDLKDNNCQDQDTTFGDATYSTIYFQDGQYFVPADNQTIVLESSNDDTNQYILNDEANTMQLDVNDPQVLEDIGMVRYYDEESGLIYCYNSVVEDDSNYVPIASGNNDFVLAGNEIIITNDQLDQQAAIDDDMVNFIDPTHNQNVVEFPSENVGFITSDNERSKYSYAILRDGKLHLRTLDPLSFDSQSKNEQDDRIAAQLEAFQQSITLDNPEIVCDLRSITGKNLITGQVVTLDSYLERLEKRKCTIGELLAPTKRAPYVNNNTLNRGENGAKYKRLFNRNVVSERLANGRKLKGKIVKIEKKQIVLESSDQVIEERNKEEDEDSNGALTMSDALNKTQILSVLEDVKGKVSSALLGLMELDSIRDQLKDKDLLIKLTEKAYNCSKNNYNKAVANVYGRMVLKESNEGKRWEFVLINNEELGVNWMHDNVASDPESSNKSDICEQSTAVCVYLLVITDKSGKKTTRVNIEQVPLSHCPFCNKTIGMSLKDHLSRAHVPIKVAGFNCNQCELNFDSMARLQKHSKVHSKNYRFECATCSKKFTRHTNWQRHVDIHKSASEVAYHCDICGCGFNYASSLTRHIVQKHISKQ